MFNFFNPPAPKPRLSQDKIPAKYAQMRLRVFWVRLLRIRSLLSGAQESFARSARHDRVGTPRQGQRRTRGFGDLDRLCLQQVHHGQPFRPFRRTQIPCRRTYSLIVADDLHGTDPLQPHKSRHQRRHYLRSDAAAWAGFRAWDGLPAGVSWPTGSPRTNAVSKCRYGIRRTRSAAARWDCS